MRAVPALLAIVLLMPTLIAAGAPSLTLGAPSPALEAQAPATVAATLPDPTVDGPCLGTCVNVPYLVDDNGDTMTGDLAFASGKGIAFRAGRLTGDAGAPLRFGASAVCLAGAAAPGCGDITGVLAGAGLNGGGTGGDVALSVNMSAVQARVTGVCGASAFLVSINADGSATCRTAVTQVTAGAGLVGGVITTTGTLAIAPEGVTSAMILNGTIGAGDVNAGEVQRRVVGVCAPGFSLRVINADGTASCEQDDDTRYAAGSGLLLNGTIFSVNPRAVQTRVAAACPRDNAIQAIREDGSVVCEYDNDTTVAFGHGLILDNDELRVDTDSIQVRVAGSCASGSAVRAVHATGAVACEADDDTLGALSCAEGEIARRAGTVWSCASHSAASYSAGAGLALDGTTFRVAEGGIGTSHISPLAKPTLAGLNATADVVVGGNLGMGSLQPTFRLNVEGPSAPGKGTLRVAHGLVDFDGLDWNGVLVAGFALRITPSGMVGIGRPDPLDRLHVGGDIRVGTGPFAGCVKDSDATVIAGTCSSDARLKRNVEPYGAVLDDLVRLEPVRFDWRTDEFPERHFGEARSFGLIAQDVEQVFPGLVVEDEHGYKAVRYHELPFLLLQGIKDLSAENERLGAANAELEQRLQRVEALLGIAGPAP